MNVTRRHFLQSAVAVTLGFAGLQQLLSGTSTAASATSTAGYGPLVSDPMGVFSLPEGFSYKIVSRAGETMSDGLLLPGSPDGMATFSGPNGETIVVRNHELNAGDVRRSAWGEDLRLLPNSAPAKIYDVGPAGVPCTGGTSNFVWDTKEQKLVSQHLSLAGTVRNCAGGPTPWGSWLTCEESVLRVTDETALEHGWVFEVPSSAEGLVAPVPLTAMGRFNHEAVAVHPSSGVIYQTEDTHDGLIYRFIPTTPGKLTDGGKLQALKVRGRPSLDMRNWESAGAIAQGTLMDVEWIDLDNVASPQDDLRTRGFAAGAARFARGEGMWYGNDAIYWACTNGGAIKKGQLFRYLPSEFEGTAKEAEFPGKVELFLESKNSELLQHCDNLCVSPWGDLIICEDGDIPQRIIGVTPQGELYKFGENIGSGSELAGACFSQDGSTLFVNLQKDGITLAITGPWSEGTATGAVVQ
jgi:hypothetical protein